MKIHFLGGSDEVGASCLLIEMAGQRLLVDAGIRVSPKARDGLSGELLPDLAPLNEGALDAVLITHAHADHIGAVPLVLGAMPDIPAYATPATIDLMNVMMADALRIMTSRSEQEGELPSYDQIQVEHLERALRPVDLREPFFINGAVRVQYFRAGHIPGAASIFLESEDGSLLISGDLSFSPMRATPIAEIPRINPDVLILETTYGGKLHANRAAEEKRLVGAITEITQNGGRVLIPAFALGRAQEVALILDKAVAAGEMPKIPVYMDGMTRSITQVFQKHPDYLSRELKKHIEKENSMWRGDAVRYVQSTAQRMEIAHNPTPCVIVASSGMLTGGASPVYAEHIIKEPQSAIFITGYQDEEAPGRMLQRLAADGGGTIILNGKKHSVACRVGTYSLSAHADENELTQYAAQLEPQQIYLVHGDGGARQRIDDLLRERGLNARQPILGQVIEPAIEIKSYLKALAARGVGTGLDLSADALWEKLLAHDLGKSTLHREQVATFWYGDNVPPAPATDALLNANPLYFAPDWRDSARFKIQSTKQVEERRTRFTWIEHISPVEGKLLLMQDSKNKPYLAVGRGFFYDQIKVITASQTDQGTLADRVVMVSDTWRVDLPENDHGEAIIAIQNGLKQLEIQISAAGKPLLTLAQIAQITDGQPRSLEAIAQGYDLALDNPEAWMTLAWRLLEFKAAHEMGQFILRPRTAGGKLDSDEDVDFNTARQLISQIIPSDARLRKISGNQSAKKITLRFDFPEVAAQHYRDLIDSVAAVTGWEIEVHPSINNLALTEILRKLLPGYKEAPSVHAARKAVEIKIEPPDNFEEIRETYQQQTGFDLEIKGVKKIAAPTQISTALPPASSEPLEINAAYAILKDALEPQGLYKVGLKGNAIVLSFITPELGARHQNLIDSLARQVGYPLAIHPHPNQNELINVILELCAEEGIALRKNPSIRIDERAVQIEPEDSISPETAELLAGAFEKATAYGVRIKG